MLLELLLLIGLIAIYQIIKKIIGQYRCLEDGEVRDFMTGMLRKNSKAYERAVAHLGLCEKCQQRVQEFDDNEKIEKHLIDDID